MIPIHPLSRRSRSGFTLIEVIVAVLIFGLVMSALVVVLRTGVRAWSAGHGMSELLQTARIAQDMVFRDLGNLVFLEESDYNETFRKHMGLLANRMYEEEGGSERLIASRERREARRAQRRRKRSGNVRDALQQDLDLEHMAAPIDLSFRGSDQGALDELTFVRAYPLRDDDDARTWGLRRVRYHVREATLWREESDPFGFRPGARAAMHYSASPGLAQAAQMFMPENVPHGAGLKPVGAGQLDRSLASAPARVEIDEPLCEGVEVFDLRFGYFKRGEWVEVGDWDSGAQNYRKPPEEMLEKMFRQTGYRPPDAAGPGMGAMMQMGGGMEIVPDNLPSYVAIQLGVRPPGGKGRLLSFTFFHAIGQAREIDEYDPEDPDAVMPYAYPDVRRRRERD